MLCPYCLQESAYFRQLEIGGYQCPRPHCSQPISLQYVEDYMQFQPVVMSLVGLLGHGKTVYLASLLLALDAARHHWPNFSWRPLDESEISAARGMTKPLQRGELPESTQMMFPRPIILRLQGIPGFDNCHLLLYDTRGEVFQSVDLLKRHGSYIAHSPVAVWLVSLKDMADDPGGLTDFLTRYVQGLRELGPRAKNQNLLIVLTKGDEIVGWPGAPFELRRFLEGDDELSGQNWSRAVALSKSIESWLDGQRDYTNFVGTAQTEFKGVNYTIVSALGSRPEGRTQGLSVVPRGVLAPLLWVLECQRQQQRIEARRAHEKRMLEWQNRASKRALAGLGAGSIVGGLFGILGMGATTSLFIGIGGGIIGAVIGWLGVFDPRPID